MLSDQFLIDFTILYEKIENSNQYPFSLPALQNLRRVAFHPSVTFFVGENGSGKSTLMEALAISLGLNGEGGSRNFNFSSRSSTSGLHSYLRVAKGFRRPTNSYFLRAESFYNVATEIEKLDAEPSFGPPAIESYGGRSLHEQSHGESFMALLNNRFSGKGLYILDEPEAALSPSKQLAALARIHQLSKSRAQFVIATHSPILMAYPGAYIYALSDDGLTRVDYEMTEHYQITKRFLLDRETMLQRLFDTSSD